jgi:NRAMP (natural resistance-associated macrophage protein)-like metal ion transporter
VAKKRRRWLAVLGPGLVAGAADDDPSGIATYSIAGAQLGTTMLWTAVLTWPLTAGVQMMCARIGMVSGYGLAEALGKKFPRWAVAVAALALFVANTFNIGADLSGMADAAQMLTRIDGRVWVVVFGAGISAALVWLHYNAIAKVLKWLAIFLFAYVLTAFILHPPWTSILADTVRPPRFHGKEAWSTLVAILGTTIGPYLFFWQTAEEVEEEKEHGKKREKDRAGATHRQIRDREVDVGLGTFFSNVVMFAVIVTTALTLHAHGITKIETSQQAAEALRPLAGRWCFLLYTAGLLGVGLLAIPTLAGSAAYALAETFGWREGLSKKLGRAPAFYTAVLLSAAIGMAIDFAHVSPVKALYWSAVVNGILAPFLLVAILLIGSDRKIMHGQPSSLLDRGAVAVTALFRFAAVAGMFVP